MRKYVAHLEIMKEIYPKYKDKITLTEIQVQDNKPETQEWINKYKVNLVPTIIMIDSNGNQVRRIEGAIPQNEMDGYLKDLKSWQTMQIYLIAAAVFHCCTEYLF